MTAATTLTEAARRTRRLAAEHGLAGRAEVARVLWASSVSLREAARRCVEIGDAGAACIALRGVAPQRGVH